MNNTSTTNKIPPISLFKTIKNDVTYVLEFLNDIDEVENVSFEWKDFSGKNLTVKRYMYKVKFLKGDATSVLNKCIKIPFGSMIHRYISESFIVNKGGKFSKTGGIKGHKIQIIKTGTGLLTNYECKFLKKNAKIK